MSPSASSISPGRPDASGRVFLPSSGPEVSSMTESWHFGAAGSLREAASPGRGWSSKTRPLSGELHAPTLCFTTVPLTVSAADVCDCRNPGPGLGASPDGQSPITARKVAIPATVRTVASKRRALVGLCRGFVGFGLACAGSFCRAGAGFECAAGSACRAGAAEVAELG